MADMLPKLESAALGRLTKRWREYQQECEQDRANGHRPHYCFHGVDQWVDYDNICPTCEEFGNRISSLPALARIEAQAVSDRLDRLIAALSGLADAGFPGDVQTYAVGYLTEVMGEALS